MSERKIAVIGDGWASLHAVGFLSHAGVEVVWLPHTGARFTAPLPSLANGAAAEMWQKLAERFEVECGPFQPGSFVREFRNKAFREPKWVTVDPERRQAELQDGIWAPESRWVNLEEGRFTLSLAEIENAVREKLATAGSIKRIEGVPVIGISDEGEGASPVKVTLGSGEELWFTQVIYADRWSVLGGIAGLPKPLSFTRGREPTGVLQASFVHSNPVGAGVLEGFYGAMQKEAGEDLQRNVWGHFFDEGRRSVWTLALSPSEVEDNHEIAKKFRRMKQALDKMFTGATWMAGFQGEFLSTVRDESVLFEEAVLFTEGEAPTEPVKAPKSDRIFFLTDGYGPSSSAVQAGELLSKRFELSL